MNPKLKYNHEYFKTILNNSTINFSLFDNPNEGLKVTYTFNTGTYANSDLIFLHYVVVEQKGWYLQSKLLRQKNVLPKISHEPIS